MPQDEGRFGKEPIFRVLGKKDSAEAMGVSIILPDGQEVGHYFPVLNVKTEACINSLNLVTMTFYARFPE